MKQFFLLLSPVCVFACRPRILLFPRHTSWVVDEAQVFPKEERNRILFRNSETGKSNGRRADGVVTLKSLNGISIEERGESRSRMRGKSAIGKKMTAQILIIVPSERQMRLRSATAGGSINDARAGDIIRRAETFFPCGTLRRRRRLRCRAGAEADYRNGSGELCRNRRQRYLRKAKNTFTDYVLVILIGIATFFLFGDSSGGSPGGSSGGGFFRGGGGGRFGGGGASGRLVNFPEWKRIPYSGVPRETQYPVCISGYFPCFRAAAFANFLKSVYFMILNVQLQEVASWI